MTSANTFTAFQIAIDTFLNHCQMYSETSEVLAAYRKDILMLSEPSNSSKSSKNDGFAIYKPQSSVSATLFFFFF